MKYLKSIFIFFAVISFFLFTPKIFAAVNSFTINDYQGGGGTVSVSQQVLPTLLLPGSTISIDGSMTWGGGAQGSNTLVSMKASLYQIYSDEVIVAPTSLSSNLTNALGARTFTAPNTPGNYVFILETTAFNQTESHNFPFTVAQPPVVNVTATPKNIAYGAISSISWNSSNSVSCASSAGGGTGASGSFYTPNLYSDTLYTVYCTNSVGDIKSGSVYVDVAEPPTPSATLIATPSSVASGGSSVLSWTSINVSWCDLYLNDIDGPILASGINNSNFNVGPLSANTTYFLHCQKNGSTISSSCTGTYQTIVPTCTGQTMGGNTCGLDEGESCGSSGLDFNPNINSGSGACRIESSPWCHHACRVVTTTSMSSCSGLNQGQCTSHSSCTWNPGLVIPPTVVDKSVTVTVGGVLPTVDVVSASNGSQGPLSVENNTNTQLRVNTSNIVSCVVKKDTVYFSNFNQSPEHTFLTGPLTTRVNPYIFEVTCTGNGGNSATDNISILVTEGAVPNFADLTTSIASYAPATIINGVPITFTATVINQGSSSTLIPFNNFLQIREIEQGGRQNLTDLSPTSVNTLVSGGSELLSKNYTFTSMKANSVYSVRFCADKSNRNDSGLIDEGENEGNNCGDWVSLSGNLPDLTTGIATPSSASVGVPVNITSLVSNQGTNTTGHGFSNSLQITNENPAITSSNPPDNFPVPNMATLLPGQIAQATISHTFNSEDLFYIRICADINSSTGVGTVAESNENNNCGAWATVTVGPSLPDLIADPVVPTSAVLNLKVNFSSKIKNQGTASTGHGFSNFFQLTNENPSGNGTNGNTSYLVKKVMAASSVNDFPESNMPRLAAGASAQAFLEHTFTSAGTYYIRACADKNNSIDVGTVNESNENNNCSEWSRVTVGSLPDLTADPVMPNTAPLNVNVNFTSKIKNQGATSTGRSFSNFFQVTNENPLYSTTPPQDLLFSNMSVLLPGESADAVVRHKFTSAGTYYIRACADKKNSANLGSVNESNENNNCSDWSSVVAGGLPDLVASNITPSTAVANVPVNLTSVITNKGTASTEHYFYNFFQVTNENPNNIGTNGNTSYLVKKVMAASSVNGLQELDHTMRTLNAGESAEATTSYLFTSAGTYYVRACADKKNSRDDGTVYESNENNNCSPNWVSVIVDLTNDKPDLVASLISPTSGLVNTEITLSSTITNQGGSSTRRNFNNFIQIATLANGGGSIQERPATQMSVLAPGRHSETITKFKFPTTGTYSVRACADKSNSGDLVGSINEGFNEDNNCGPHWTNIRITSEKVDASCAPSHYNCIPYTIIGTNLVADNTNRVWRWDCEGLSGGSSVSCQEPMPNLGGSVGCGVEKYTCDPGEPTTLPENTTEYNWKCTSSNGLNSIFCSKLKDDGGNLYCFDGIQNQGETGVDCGGPCPRCGVSPKYKEN